MQGLAKHLAVEVTDLDHNTVVSGFLIASDFSLGLPEIRDISKFKSRKFGDKAGSF